MLLTFNINKQLIKRTDCEIPVAKSENYLYAQFSFSDEWVGTKTAIFNNGTAYSVILDEDNKCLVPWEVITESGFSVSVYCGERITANVSFVKVLPSGYIEGQTPADPTPTVYEQIIEELNGKLEPENLIAGANITIKINGKSVIISSTGGGGGDIAIDSSLKKVNNVLGIDFATLSEQGFDKLNNAVTALTVQTLLGNLMADFGAALEGKQDSFTVGQNLRLQNDILTAIITNSLKTVQSLGSEGTEGVLYLVPQTLPSDIAELVNLAYEHWGDLSRYPYLVCYENNTTKWLGLSQAAYKRTPSGYMISDSSDTVDYEIEISKTTGDKTFRTVTGRYHPNHWFNYVSASNYDILLESVVYFAANIDSDIDYSSGATIAKTFKGYMWNGTSFDYQGLTNLALLFDGVATKSELDNGLATKQDTLVNQSNIKSINGTSLLGSGDMSVQPVTATATITDNSTTALADNTEYTGSNLTTVTFTYPSGDFECYMSLSFASSGTITVTFPTSQYIGSVPTFENGKTYEISIKNGVIVAGEVTSGA